MKYVKYLVLFSILIFSTTYAQKNKETDLEKPELIISFTSDATLSPHSTLMGMHLAQKAIKNNVKVTLFFNVSGVKLLLPSSKDITFHNEKLTVVLSQIIESGGTVIACPHCMEVYDVKQVDLPKGVIYGKDKLLIDTIKLSPSVFTY